jgi:hypothetical protein
MHSMLALVAAHTTGTVPGRGFAIAVAVFLVVVLLFAVGFARSLAGRSDRRRSDAGTAIARPAIVIGRFPRRPRISGDITTMTAAVGQKDFTAEEFGEPNPTSRPRWRNHPGS